MPDGGVEPPSLLPRLCANGRGSAVELIGLLYKASGVARFPSWCLRRVIAVAGVGPFIFQLLARPTLPRNLLLYVSMSIISSLTHCLDTTLTRLPLTVTRVRKVASTDPCLVFAEGCGLEPLAHPRLFGEYLLIPSCRLAPSLPAFSFLVSW